MTRLAYRSGASLVPRNFSPRRIRGCTLWLDGNDLSTLHQTDDTSTPVTADNVAMGRWVDKSGAARVLSQSTADERPTWRNQQAGANGMGAMVTPATAGAGSDYLTGATTTASLFGATEATLFLVFRSATTGANQTILRDSAGLLLLRWSGATTLFLQVWNGTAGESQLSLTAAAATTYIICVRRSSAPILYASLNGGAETSVASAGVLVFGANTQALPCVQASTKHDGWIGQWITYNRDLGAHERNRVGRYLASLYGTTWTGN